MKKVVLAYSGGLDTSVAVAWLREQHDAEVVTLTVDVGGGSLREGVAERAISAGASKAYVVDGRDRFVRQFVFPSLQANARYQGVYPLATALARPLIAQLLVEVAERERADAVAHGCTGKGNDQVRFDVAVRALDPKLEVVAPDARGHRPVARAQEIDYAVARGIEIPATTRVAVLGRPEPVGPVHRDGHPRGSVADAAGRRLRMDRRPRRRARPSRPRSSSASRAAFPWHSTASPSPRSSWSSA